MSLPQGDVDVVASDDGNTVAYLWATLLGAPLPVHAPLPVPAVEGMVVASGGSTEAYLWATLQVAPIAVPAAEEDFRAVVMVYVDDLVAFADFTNVSCRMSSLDDPVVTSGIERVDLPPVLPDTGAPAICSIYEHCSDKEDLLLL